MTAAFYLAAAHQSSGKTSVAIGLAACWVKAGVTVQPFKKGPDYIDPSWLTAAAGRPCYVVDPYLESFAAITDRFWRYASRCDVAFVEGNMGLHDGIALDGSDSNAAVAAALRLPVVLVFDAKGLARTAAALLLGLAQFDSRLTIAGVILNRVATPRHEAKLRAAIDHYCPFPVLGALPGFATPWVTERHLGLIPADELAERREQVIDALAAWVAAHVDTSALLKLVTGPSAGEAARDQVLSPTPDAPKRDEGLLHALPKGATARETPNNPALQLVVNTLGELVAQPIDRYEPPRPWRPVSSERRLRLAIARDAAFHFYYAEDLAEWSARGVELLFFDTLRDRRLPPCDALWLGGGFPESAALALAENQALRQEIAAACRDGLPVYAECGGLLYLGESLVTHSGEQFPMCGVLPGFAVMEAKPVGRGYLHLAPLDHPWHQAAAIPSEVRAHEFHHARWHWFPEAPPPRYAWRVVRGFGIDGHFDGACWFRVVAGFAHLRSTLAWSWVDVFLGYFSGNFQAEYPNVDADAVEEVSDGSK